MCRDNIGYSVLMLDPKTWKIIDQNSTGYLGKRRNAAWAKRDELYGKYNWRMSWLVEDRLLEYPEACELYEDAYFLYFQQRPELLTQLLETASDVYDDDPKNIESGTDYQKRGAIRTHIQDIAIRRCVQRFGKQFHGKSLLQIRDRLGIHPLSLALSPGQVPFHKPKLLSFPENFSEIVKDAWWLSGSVEDWYQRAKRLCVRK